MAAGSGQRVLRPSLYGHEIKINKCLSLRPMAIAGGVVQHTKETLQLMKFKELETYKTTIENFPLKWRFDSLKADELADFDSNLTVINKKGCKKIGGFLENWELHSDFPFISVYIFFNRIKFFVSFVPLYLFLK